MLWLATPSKSLPKRFTKSTMIFRVKGMEVAAIAGSFVENNQAIFC